MVDSLVRCCVKKYVMWVCRKRCQHVVQSFITSVVQRNHGKQSKVLIDVNVMEPRKIRSHSEAESSESILIFIHVCLFLCLGSPKKSPAPSCFFKPIETFNITKYDLKIETNRRPMLLPICFLFSIWIIVRTDRSRSHLTCLDSKQVE